MRNDKEVNNENGIIKTTKSSNDSAGLYSVHGNRLNAKLRQSWLPDGSIKPGKNKINSEF